MIDDEFKLRVWKDFRHDFGGFVCKCQIPVRRRSFGAFRALAVLHVRQILRPEGENVPIGVVFKIGAEIVAENLPDFWIGEACGAAVWLAAAIFHRKVFRMFFEEQVAGDEMLPAMAGGADLQPVGMDEACVFIAAVFGTVLPWAAAENRVDAVFDGEGKDVRAVRPVDEIADFKGGAEFLLKAIRQAVFILCNVLFKTTANYLTAR